MQKNFMSGIVLTGHGGPECLVWRDDLPMPVPMQGEVLVRLRAAAVNNTDINTRLAWYSKGDGTADDASWAGVPIAFPSHVCAGPMGVRWRGPGFWVRNAMAVLRSFCASMPAMRTGWTARFPMVNSPAFPVPIRLPKTCWCAQGLARASGFW